MPFYDLSYFNDSRLLQDGLLTAKRERGESANLLAYIAEIDSRGLFVTAGCSSMFAYCLKHYRLSEDAANARIQVARVARKYPFLFEALQDGRLHITGVRLLAPHLTPDNARELAAAATHRTMTEIQRLIAQRFPLDEPPKMTQTIRAIPSGKVGVPVSRRVDPLFEGLNGAFAPSGDTGNHPAAHPSDTHPSDTPGTSQPAIPPPSPAPSTSSGLPSALAPPAQHHFVPERYLLRFTVDRDTHDKLRYAQMLGSHSNPGGSLERIMSVALDLYIAHKEKQRFAATTRPRPRLKAVTPRPNGGAAPRNANADSAASQKNGDNTGSRSPVAPPVAPSDAPPRQRYIPAEVRRAVWTRDQGRCTAVSASGDRCDSTEFVEFDHVDPVSRGGQPTVEGLRLLCRAHNQYEAEMALGPEFMNAKREEARARRAETKGTAAPAPAPDPGADGDPDLDPDPDPDPPTPGPGPQEDHDLEAPPD
jgi:5-methylcytosine-specific restriction endonuclease McrA